VFQDERTGPNQPVACQQCGASVLVKKNSLAHTLVQWMSSTDACPRLASHGQARATTPTCGFLRETIEAAIRTHELEVGDLPVPGQP